MLRTPPADGAWNMAVDLALLDVARAENIGVLRVYGWRRPTVSFGRNEAVAGLLTPAALQQSDFDFVRRPTGGRALLHHREVTYSVTMPLAQDIRWGAAYAATNALLLEAMIRLGIPASLGRPASATAPAANREDASSDLRMSEVCFSGIAEGEVAIESRKLVASSVWRDRNAYLQHGSILVFDDQLSLMTALGGAISTPKPAAVLSDWVPDADTVEGATALVEHALQTSVERCGSARRWSIPDDIVPAIEAKRHQLVSSDWLWRR